MARKLPAGTPTRTTQYLFPGNNSRLLWGSVGAGLLVSALMIGSWFLGVERVLSPGPVAAPHATIGTECILCHAVGATVEDLRCERCHDSGSTQRLTNQAHVFFGSGDARKAATADRVACINCHVDHRGVEATLWAADDRECGTCHQFSTLARHPEFAAVTANTQTGLGLKFNHDKHIVRVEEATGGGCEACHVETVDRTDFEPISFDRHCSTCHTTLLAGDKSGRVSGELVVAVADVPEEYQQPGIIVETAGSPRRPKLDISGMIHRDPWALYNVTKLRREIDPESERQERAALESQLAWLRQQQRGQPLRGLSTAQLAPLAAALDGQIERLEGRLEAALAGGSSRENLEAIGRATLSTAAELSTAGFTAGGRAAGFDDAVEAAAQLPASLAPLVDEISAAPVATEVESEDAAAIEARFDRRRQELEGLLDAIEERGGEAFADRVADLRSELSGLQPDDTSDAADVAALQAQLDNLDTALRVIYTLNDPDARFAGSQVDLLRRIGSQRVGGGLSPARFESRRSEILDLLDAIERRGSDDIRLRAASLRQRAIAVRAGDSGTADMERQLEAQRRLLARVDLELELEAQGAIGEGTDSIRDRPLALGSQRDLEAIDEGIQRIEARLAGLASGPRSPVAPTPAERDERRGAIEKLLLACSKCHIVLPDSGVAPVRVTEPVLPFSIFNHAPHVTQVSCESCHGVRDAADPRVQRIFASGAASDVNVPGVTECAVCHQPDAVSDDCETCHRYHPPSIGDFLSLR